MLSVFLTSKVVGAVARHLMTAGGAYLAAEGLVDPATDGAAMEAISGGVVALAGLGLSMIEKARRR